MLLEEVNTSLLFSKKGIFLIFLSGIFAFGISKWFWMEGIKRIGVAKSNAIETLYPVITLLLAYYFLSEIPTHKQMFGLLFVFVGVPLIVSPIKNLPFSGITVRGNQIGTKLSFPTMNIQTNDKISEGVFAVHAEISDTFYKGVLYAGPRPTLEKTEFCVEMHLFDCSNEVPDGTEIKGEICKKIRNVQEMEDLEGRKKQLATDIKKVKKYL